MKKLFVLIIFVTAATSWAAEYTDFDSDWRFSLGNFPNAMIPDFDDSDWRNLNLPHDWSVEGPFGPEYSSGNGYTPGGVGWYRKHFTLDEKYKDKLVAIEFDGVYNNSQVWINGQLLGTRPYGYISFQYDMTGYLNFGSEQNIIAVRVDHSKFADSRWYTGSGIYRHVRLRISDKLHIGHWDTFVTTPKVADDSATIHIETIINNSYNQAKDLTLELTIITPDDDKQASDSAQVTIAAQSEQTVTRQIKISDPQLWSLETPVLYTLQSRIKTGETILDETSTPFGIRTLRFDANEGFFLNGKPMKIKGVCIHHDAGCVGAAVPEKVLERRLRILKDLGVNAIRTSHNPPAPELLDLCDRLGLLVKDEAFDEFTPPKNKWIRGWNSGQPSRFGYGEVFTEWSVTDMQDMVRRDRNHPCVFMWSIGNEIDYANDPFSHPVLGDEYRPTNPPAENLVKYAKPLVEAAKKLDTSRPVTAALANIRMSNAVGLPQLLDIVGYNYQESAYAADHKTYPARVIFGSENRHQYEAWAVVLDNDYVAGQFLWTGIDYLGEAGRWPNRASSSGMLDLCGFKKPLAWFRQSLWSDKPMVYLCASPARGSGRSRRFRTRVAEHWNWPVGQNVTVMCYTNCPDVSLMLNNKFLGAKKLSDAEQAVLSWDIPYESGTLTATGRNSNGDAICTYTLQTAGTANKIVLLPDVTKLQADGKDICHLTFEITDARGMRVPDAQNELTFTVEGSAAVIGIENGNTNSTENPKDLVHKTYRGRGLAIVQSKTTPGPITITATCPDLEPATITLTSQ